MINDYIINISKNYEANFMKNNKIKHRIIKYINDKKHINNKNYY